MLKGQDKGYKKNEKSDIIMKKNNPLPNRPTRRHFVATGITQQSTTGNTALAAIKSSYTDLNLWRALE